MRATMAHAMMAADHSQAAPPCTSAALGALTLLPHQLDAASRLHAILREHRVALLADDVGLGKTYVALAVARDYRQVRIIVPAALLPMWRSALTRAQCSHAQLESLHCYSSAHPPANVCQPGTLVIVDEAHHLRTPTTRRYRAISQVLAGSDLLLLSATPIHNSPRDLGALLALALGTPAARLRDGLLARVVVRRTHRIGRPRIVEHPPMAMPHDPAVLDAILALPAPLPAHDGAIAGALIRLGLLRAWCSSDAALTQALRKRLLRGEALRHALEHGRHPTSAELRSWLVGEHEVQLAFPELLANHAPATGPLLDILSAHLDAVRGLLHEQMRVAHSDAARVDAMRTIMRAHPNVPVVAFSQFAATVRAVGRALADIAGVGMLTGQRAVIASGAISRQEALAHFAPVAQGRPPPPAHRRIHLLLTTDLLAEGVNLQDAGVVVHLDLPWTDALRHQRVGRCARVGSPHSDIAVYRINPPPGAEAALRLFERLARKAQWETRLVGGRPDERRNESSGTGRGSAADAATQLRELLQSWLRDDRPSDCVPAGSRPRVSTVTGPRTGFVAVVALATGSVALVAGWRRSTVDGSGSWRLSTSPRRALALLQGARADNQSDPGDPVPVDTWHRAQRALLRWCTRRTVATDLGQSTLAISSTHRRAYAALSRAVAPLSPVRRVALRESLRQALRMVAQVRGVAAEQALDEWLRGREEEPLECWLSRWPSWTALSAATNLAAPDGPAPQIMERAANHIVAVFLINHSRIASFPR
ncbi:MAG: DEAD/DEAH box helicase [Gemmatimonadaceae bacterium]|nr:DEAD/DEAH box helicase [Gemmatimonadaceae bacterium]